MRRGRFRCQICLNKKLKEEAREQDCVLVSAGKSNQYRTYRLACGHNQQIQVTAMRRGEFWCQSCFQNRLEAEARAQGCILLGPGTVFYRRLYRLECGHEQEVGTKEMKIGRFRCQTCGDYYYTRPSNVYLLHIRCGADEWLKLGFSRIVDNRIEGYGLPTKAQVVTVATEPFDSALQAMRFEKSLHKKYVSHRLAPTEMAYFHTMGGQTECYPVTMIDRLLTEFKKHD